MLPALYLTTSFELREYFREEENFELGLESKYLCVKKKKRKRNICEKVKSPTQRQICVKRWFSKNPARRPAKSNAKCAKESGREKDCRSLWG